MKKILAILALTAQICFAVELNLSWFYSDASITSEQVDNKLDKILAFLEQNPQRVNDEFGEFKDRLFTPFIFNSKILNTHRYDFERIGKMLKFKPDLNYKIDVLTPLGYAVTYGANVDELPKFDKNDVLHLADMLIANGADIGDTELLVTACSLNGVEIYTHLLKNGASIDEKKIFTCLVGGAGIFMGQNGFPISFKEALGAQAKEFVKSKKFLNFYQNHMKFFEELLNFRPLHEIDDKNFKNFAVLNLLLDYQDMIKFLLQKGVCESENLSKKCKILKEFALKYDAKESMKVLNLSSKPLR